MPKAAGVDIGHEVEKIGEEEEKEEDDEEPETITLTKTERAKEIFFRAKTFVIESYTSTDRLRDKWLKIIIP